jgi:hypothetical protein
MWWTIASFFAIQELEVVDANLRAVPGDSIFVVPLPGLKLTLDEYLRALTQELSHGLGSFAEGHASMPLNMLFLLAGCLVFPAAIRCHRYGCHGIAARQVSGIWVLAQVADYHCFVHSVSSS